MRKVRSYLPSVNGHRAPLSANGPHRKGGWTVELAAALLSVVAPLVPEIKGWLDSVAQRNRSLARAEIIRARLASPSDSWDKHPKREADNG